MNALSGHATCVKLPKQLFKNSPSVSGFPLMATALAIKKLILVDSSETLLKSLEKRLFPNYISFQQNHFIYSCLTCVGIKFVSMFGTKMSLNIAFLQNSYLFLANPTQYSKIMFNNQKILTYQISFFVTSIIFSMSCEYTLTGKRAGHVNQYCFLNDACTRILLLGNETK